jgi:hypothetical protein
MLFITLVLCAVGIGGVAKAGQVAMRRLGLDPMELLLFLGLAERPS